jgi:hypothetical protein
MVAKVMIGIAQNLTHRFNFAGGGPPIFLPLPWEPPYLPSENQAIYLGSGTSLVDGAGAVCTHTNVALLAATGQTGFSLPFPATSFPAFGGYTHLTSPTPGGTYLKRQYLRAPSATQVAVHG